ADRIGEALFIRQQWTERAPGKLAVADFTPSGRAKPTGFADGVRREIVMQQEVLAVLTLERIDDLFILAGAKGRHRQRLGFAAREQGGAVRTRQDADLAEDRADSAGVATVDPPCGLEDGAANDLAFQLLELRRDQLEIETLLDQGGKHRRLDLVNACVTILLLDDAIRLG